METIYRCSQDELYTALKMGWNSCEEYLTDFADFKARYTPTYITEQRSALAAALAMPNDQARSEVAETLRIQMLDQATQCRNLWQRLKRYIADAYPQKLQKPKLEAAGSDKYEKASNNNWDSLQALMQAGSNFITQNLPDLTANQNMPLVFPDKFKTAQTTFDALHQQFLASEEQARLKTQTKQTANNRLYTDLISMLLDGQEIFKDNPALVKQFIFAELLYRISGAGTAGIRGYITDKNTTFALPNVSVTIINTTLNTLSNPEGKYEINQIAAGIYTLKFEKIGYQTQIIENHEIKIGTKSKIDIVLEPADN